MRKYLIGATFLLLSCSKPPYAELDRSSYGGLMMYKDQYTKQLVAPPSCDPNNKDRDTNNFTTTVLGKIMEPVGGMTKIDQKVLKEELQDKFRNPGTFTGPNVVIIENSPNKIVFWYMSDLVSLDEVRNAAKDYCLKRHKQAFYEGSARQCGKPQQLPWKIQSKDVTSVPTYAISSFQCGMQPQFSRGSALRGTEQ